LHHKISGKQKSYLKGFNWQNLQNKILALAKALTSIFKNVIKYLKKNLSKVFLKGL
jgi:hypothetical protein